MSGQNGEIDGCLDVWWTVRLAEASPEQERSQLLQVMSSNLRDEGWLFALLYIVKWTEKKKKRVTYWDIILNKKKIYNYKEFC